jgi:hypothetical protein
MSDEKKSKGNTKKEDGKFSPKKIKHDPQDESARTVFGKHDDENR